MVCGRTDSARWSPNGSHRWSPVGVVGVPCGDQTGHQHARKSDNTAVVQSPRALSRLPRCIVPRDTPTVPRGPRSTTPTDARCRRGLPRPSTAPTWCRLTYRAVVSGGATTATIDYVAGPSRRCFTVHVDASRSSGLPSAGRAVRHRAPPARWFPPPTSCASECPWARRSSEASAQCPPRPVRAGAIQQSAPARDVRSDDLRHGRVLATVSDRLTGSLSNPRRGAVDTSVGRGRVRRFGSSCQQLCT